MVDIITFPPEEGTDIAIKILDNNNNVCSDVAYAIYEQYAQECAREQRTKVIFAPDRAFQFSNGLVFGLFNGNQGLTIDFYVPPESGVDKRTALLTLPALLRNTGINDEGALNRLQSVIEQSQSPSPTPKRVIG